MNATQIIDCDLLTLTDAAKRLPGRPHRATIWRWARQGILTSRGNRVKLETVRLGRNVLISPEAIAKFSAALGQADRERFDARPIRTAQAPSRRSSRAAQAEAEAAALGI